MHPRDQLGIQRAVRHAVGPGAVDERVHVLDALDDAGRGLGVAERRGQHVAQRGAGALERVLPVVRQILHARDHGGMKDLQHDRGQPGLGDRGQIGVDLPRDAVRPDQAGIARRAAVDLRIVVTTGVLLEVLDDAAAQRSSAPPGSRCDTYPTIYTTLGSGQSRPSPVGAVCCSPMAKSLIRRIVGARE